MIVKLLSEHHLEFLSLKGDCTGSSESTLVKMSNCWKSHALAHFKYNSWALLPYIRDNAFAYTFEPNIWDYSIPVLKVS